MYYIYHIKGVKIGCSTNPKRRAKSKGYLEYQILEIHTNIDTASDREIELQKQYGYPIDTIPYKVSYQKRKQNRTKKDCAKGGKTQGKINATNGHLDKVRDVKKGGIAASSIVRECPHCGTKIKGPRYFALHGDKCKNKMM